MIQIIPIIAAVIVAGVALYIRHKNRTQAVRDALGVFMQKQIAELPNRGVCEFYKQTKPAIRNELAGIKHFLSGERLARLNRLWKEYDEIPAAELSEENEPEYRKYLELACGDKNFKTPRDIVTYYLDEFYKFAK